MNTYESKILKKFGLSNKGSEDSIETADSDSLMSDARYLRQSSALINDALQKGFDVLQLANGDIVTTGTKVVVYQYSWDEAKGKLARTKVGGDRRRRANRAAADAGNDAADSQEKTMMEKTEETQ